MNGIRAFEAVARLRSFTRAAEELNVTQSAISHQIRNLEQRLGVTLFRRDGKELTLTPEGADWYPDVHEAMMLIKRSVDRLHHLTDERPFGLWLRSHFALKWLTPRLSDFRTINLTFELRLIHSNQPADFSDPAVDMSIEWLPSGGPRDDARLLVAGDLTPACSPALLRDGGGSFSPEDLSHHTLLHESDTATWLEWLAVAGVAQLKPQGNLYFDDTNVRHQAAMEGQGFALVCPTLVRDDVDSGRLVCPLEATLETYNYYVVCPSSGQLSAAARKFSNWLFTQTDTG